MNEIIDLENTLRRLIIKILGEDDYTDYSISDKKRDQWLKKREEQRKKNKGILLESRLLFYSEFHDLLTIISNTKNWGLFKPIFQDKKKFEVYFNQILNFRNQLAHGRILTNSQRNLKSGIVGEIKNQITIFHNKNEMKEDFFIEITQVTDNLGNFWDDNNRTPCPVLKVGSIYEINIEANDPKDREIEYSISSLRGEIDISQKSNHFEFEITKEMISKHFINQGLYSKF